MWQDWQNHLEALAYARRTAGKVDDERRAACSRHGAAEHGERCLCQRLAAHRLDDSRRLPVQRGERRFGGDVGRAEAGATCRQNQIEMYLITPAAQERLD